MEMGLKNRVALVAGGSRGIGKAVVLALAREGVKLVVCARREEGLKLLQDEIHKLGGHVKIVAADGKDVTSVQQVILAAIECYGQLDILVNNVGGIERFAGFEDIKDEEWLEAFHVNVMSVVYFMRESLPYLRKSKAPRIINISSISGIQPGYFNPHYTTTKAAVINLTKQLANSLASSGILVNAVCPGPVLTESWSKNVDLAVRTRGITPEEAFRQIVEEEKKKIPLGSLGTADDVAGIVTFLASDKAGWITGSCFHINGGKLSTIS